MRAAQKLVDGLSARFARNVPERQVDPGHGVPSHADPAIVVGRRHHPVRAGVDVQGIGAGQRVGQAVADLVRKRRVDDGLDHGGTGIDFAPARDPFVCLDFDQAGILRPVTGLRHLGQPQDQGGNVDDPHANDLLDPHPGNV